jgi:hypothetical protein
MDRLPELKDFSVYDGKNSIFALQAGFACIEDNHRMLKSAGIRKNRECAVWR